MTRRLCFIQAGIVETLDSLVKEFVSAGSDEKKAIYGRIEEEVEKLEGSAARWSYWLHGLYVLHKEQPKVYWTRKSALFAPIHPMHK